VMLLRLGGGLPERLIAEAAAHWSQRLEADDVEPADLPSLEAALYGRVLATTDTWLGGAANVELSMIGPHEDPYLHRQRDHVDLGLPFHWLSRVWAPGTSVMNGQLILDAHHAGDDTSLLATSPDGTLNTLTITRRPGGGR
jgi:hypothetical protein